GYWGFGGSTEPPVAESLNEMIRNRLRRLSSAAIDVATVLALLGRPTDLSQLLALTAQNLATITKSLTELERAEFARRRPQDGKYQLAHPLYETGILSFASQTQCAVLHGLLVDVLRKEAANHAELAYHA